MNNKNSQHRSHKLYVYSLLFILFIGVNEKIVFIELVKKKKSRSMITYLYLKVKTQIIESQIKLTLVQKCSLKKKKSQ